MSELWSVMLTVVFVLTGGYSLWRWAGAVASRSGRREEATVDLNHLVMSVAMVSMTWWPAGAVAIVVQGLVFAGFALALLPAMVRDGDGSRRLGLAAQLAMNLAMIWMLLAMPWLMAGTATGAGQPTGHHHGGGHQAAIPTPAGISAPAWMDAVSWIAVGLMVISALWWGPRAIRAQQHRVHFCCHGLMGVGMAVMIGAMA